MEIEDRNDLLGDIARRNLVREAESWIRDGRKLERSGDFEAAQACYKSAAKNYRRAGLNGDAEICDTYSIYGAGEDKTIHKIRQKTGAEAPEFI